MTTFVQNHVHYNHAHNHVFSQSRPLEIRLFVENPVFCRKSRFSRFSLNITSIITSVQNHAHVCSKFLNVACPCAALYLPGGSDPFRARLARHRENVLPGATERIDDAGRVGHQLRHRQIHLTPKQANQPTNQQKSTTAKTAKRTTEQPNIRKNKRWGIREHNDHGGP